MKSCSFLLLRRKRSSIFFLLGLLNPRIRRWQSVSHHLAPVVRNRSSHRMFPPAGTPLLPTPPPHAAGCRRKSRTRALVYSALGYSCHCLCSFQDSTPQTQFWVMLDLKSQFLPLIMITEWQIGELAAGGQGGDPFVTYFLKISWLHN